MRTPFVGVLGSAVLSLLPRSGLAATEVPRSINPPPRGVGAEQVSAAERRVFREGLQATAGLGSGFSSTYGLGMEADLGYTLRQGVFAGVQVQYFMGQTVNDQTSHAAFVGGQLGYKFFPTREVEIRPFAFVGPAFITQVTPSSDPNTPHVVNKIDVAVQPGVIAQYHFGNAYVGGDAHFMLTPSPNTLALMATAGLAF